MIKKKNMIISDIIINIIKICIGLFDIFIFSIISLVARGFIIFLIILYILLGVWFIYRGIYGLFLDKMVKVYINLLQLSEMTDCNNLKEKEKKQLQMIIERGLIEGIYIDYKTNEIVIINEDVYSYDQWMTSEKTEKQLRLLSIKKWIQTASGLYFFLTLQGLTILINFAPNGEGLDKDIKTVLYIMGIVIGGIAFLLFRFAYQNKNLIKKYRDYKPRLLSDKIYQIAQLAHSANDSPDIVVKNLKNMIKHQLFINLYINSDNGVIINEIRDQLENKTKSIKYSGHSERKIKKPENSNRKKQYRCKSCGALVNTNEEGELICEYCGTILQE